MSRVQRTRVEYLMRILGITQVPRPISLLRQPLTQWHFRNSTNLRGQSHNSTSFPPLTVYNNPQMMAVQLLDCKKERGSEIAVEAALCSTNRNPRKSPLSFQKCPWSRPRTFQIPSTDVEFESPVLDSVQKAFESAISRAWDQIFRSLQLVDVSFAEIHGFPARKSALELVAGDPEFFFFSA